MSILIKVVETDAVVISGAYIQLHRVKQSETSVAAVVPNAQAAKANEEQFIADKIFEELSLKLKSNPDIVKSIKAIYEFQITKGDLTKAFSNNFKINNKFNLNSLNKFNCFYFLVLTIIIIISC